MRPRCDERGNVRTLLHGAPPTERPGNGERRLADVLAGSDIQWQWGLTRILHLPGVAELASRRGNTDRDSRSGSAPDRGCSQLNHSTAHVARLQLLTRPSRRSASRVPVRGRLGIGPIHLEPYRTVGSARLAEVSPMSILRPFPVGASRRLDTIFSHAALLPRFAVMSLVVFVAAASGCQRALRSADSRGVYRPRGDATDQ